MRKFLIAALLASVLVTFLRTHPIGWVMVEARYRLPDDNENDFIPDVSFVSKEQGPLVEKGPAPYMPDFVVEIKSPDDKIPDMRKKAAYYLAHGSRLVWLVYTEKKRIIVLTADSEVTLNEDDQLNGGEVLPGFELLVRDIFPE